VVSKNKGQLSPKTGQTSNLSGQKVLMFFYENPSAEVAVRTIASILNISRSTVQRNLQDLRKEGILDSNNRWIDSWSNKIKKVNFYTEEIVRSGLVDFLEKELAASAIILFGSFSKGDSIKSSDIDIFVECAREKALNVRKYEVALGHRIELFTKQKITLLPKRLLNNVVNGVKLKGYFTIK